MCWIKLLSAVATCASVRHTPVLCLNG